MNGCLVKSALFSFARLFAINHEIRDVIRYFSPGTMRVFASIPGEVGHRLKIVTTLAAIIDEYREPIGKALEAFNMAFSSRVNWKSSTRQSTLTHAREVYFDLIDPRMVICARSYAPFTHSR